MKTRHMSVLLVRTGHDAQHFGLDDRERNTARGAEPPAKPTLHMSLPESTKSAELSFWYVPTMMPSISGLPTTKGNTAHQTTKSESGTLAHSVVSAHHERIEEKRT